METSFIIQSWLEADGDINEIREYIILWLQKYIKSDKISFLIKKYIAKEKYYHLYLLNYY